MRNARKLTALALATVGVLAFSSAPAWAGNGYENVTSTFGSEGTGPGQFKEPTSIAVNDENEDVYVLDRSNDRVEAFNNKHEFQFEFNGTGSPTGKFLHPKGIAVDNSCASQNPALTGAECEAFDPSNGDVYVADGADIEPFEKGHEVVDKFSATGKYEGQFTGTCREAGESPPGCGTFFAFGELMDVAVDPSGNLWVYEGNGPEVGGAGATQADELSDTGSAMETRVLHTSARPELPGFAVDSNGDVFSATGGVPPEKVRIFENNKAAGEEYALTESANPETTLAIIAANNDLLIDEGSSIELFKSPISGGAQPILTFPSTGLSESKGVAVNGAKGDGTIYATQRGDDDVDVLDSEPAKAPVVASESASTVEVEEAHVVEFTATIDPENRATTYSFEYSTEASENNPGELELEGEIEKVSGATALPAEFGDQTATSPAIEGLSVKKTIYYRVVAENDESNGTPTVGKVKAYTKLPLVENEKFSGLTSTSAELDATVNSVFVNTEYWFEYAPDRALLEESNGTVEESKAIVVPNHVTEIEGAGPEPFSTEISGLQPGQTYYYRVVATNAVSKYTGNANKGKPVRGKIEEVTPYAAPAIVTGQAQNITGTAATLSGEVDPEGTEAKYYFAYIDKEGYEKAIKGDTQEQANPYAEGETTATNALPVGDQPVTVGPIPANDLLPGVTYHYALVSVNKYAIQTIGPDQRFTTHAGTPPGVSTGGASNVSQNAATLSGTVTTNGLQTNYGFEIGTAPGVYGPATGLGAIGGAATEEVHVTLGELQPGTTYYYRVEATNADGTEKGQPGSFTTPGFPTLISPPASPPLIAYTAPAFPKEEKAATTTKTLTNEEKLAKALKTCKKDKSKTKKAKCEAAARKKYPVASRKKGKKKKK